MPASWRTGCGSSRCSFDSARGHDRTSVSGGPRRGRADSSRLYLELIAENVGLAVANIQLCEKLTSLAVRDPLTSLFNRRHLDESLKRYSSDTTADAIACLMIDIDHFKRFNDEFGHEAGDMAMQHVGQILRDSVGPSEKAFRFGGEEFTVLLHHCTEQQAVELGEMIMEKISGGVLSHAGP